MKLSVILACYNGALTLAMQLEALKKQEWDHPWEVIVADNGSTDDSVALAKRYAEGWRGLRIVDVSARRGKPSALNAAIRTSTSEFIAFCDQDDEVAPGWVAAIGNALEEHDFVGGRLEEKKLNPSWLRWPQQVDGFFKLWYPPFLRYASGCCLGMKRSLFDAVGDFDESLAIIDDADYCIRVQQRGTPLVFVGQAVVHYRRRDSLRALFKQARSYGEWNSVLAKKYVPGDSGVRRKVLHQVPQRMGELAAGCPLVSPQRHTRVVGMAVWLSSRQTGRNPEAQRHSCLVHISSATRSVVPHRTPQAD